MFVVVDYEKGNIRSVQKGVELAGAQTAVSTDADVIAKADAIVLPGVGSFADASEYMLRTGQMQAIRASIARGVPFLGICLGLQLLLERGEEGVAAVNSRQQPDASWAEGIGAIAGHVRRVDDRDAAGVSYKVPHVGWNQVCYQADEAALRPLLAGVEDGSNFYFTHSYQGVCSNPSSVLATVTHAGSFPAVIACGNAFGVQFHPEKSSHKGLQVLENFVRFAKEC